MIRFIIFCSKRGYYYILVHTLKRNQHNLVPQKDSTNICCHGKLMGTPIFVYKKIAGGLTQYKLNIAVHLICSVLVY